MTVRRLDEWGDILTSGGIFTGGREEVAQVITTRLRLFLGEYFRNTNDGTPWFQQILGKNTNPNTRDAVIRNRIITTRDVLKLLSYSATFDTSTRTCAISASVLTIFGEVEILYNGTIDSQRVSA